jgi:hypothetical protein
MVGRDPGLHLALAAAEMQVSGWLEAVLSWPRRFLSGAADDAFALASGEPGPPDR